MTNDPIGIFDSGVGGLSIFQGIIQELPHENIVYFADSKRCPYGSKSETELKKITRSVVHYLIEKHHIKLAVVACNTATVTSINYLREEFPTLPFVGVVPVIKPASQMTKTKKIACLATDVTAHSSAQANLIHDFAHGVEVYNVACPQLAELIEQGNFENPILLNKLNEYLNPIIDKGIDILALGCTHYPLIKNLIESMIPNHITVMDSCYPVAKQVRRLLTQFDILNNTEKPFYHYLVHGSPQFFDYTAKHFLNGLFSPSEEVKFSS